MSLGRFFWYPPKMCLGKGLGQEKLASTLHQVILVIRISTSSHVQKNGTIGTKYSRMNQVKFVEDSLGKKFIWSILEYFVANETY